MFVPFTAFSDVISVGFFGQLPDRLEGADRETNESQADQKHFKAVPRWLRCVAERTSKLHALRAIPVQRPGSLSVAERS